MLGIMNEHPIEKLLKERIVILDGAMGTNIQTYRLDEAAYRGTRLAGHATDLKGNNDLLAITRPQVVEEVHTAFLEAGADIIETNTFNATTLSQADYGLEPLAYELNVAAAGCARRAADRVANATGIRRFVAGAIGPLSKTLSISRDVNDPGARDVTFDQVRDGVRRATARTDRGRRGPDPRRDDLRHAQRQGRAVRDPGVFRQPSRRPACPSWSAARSRI